MTSRGGTTVTENNTAGNGRNAKGETSKAPETKPGKVPIYIDGTKYHPDSRGLTGAQVRQLPSPPIGADRDLWLDIVDELDKLVEDNDVVDLMPNMRFFSVPRVINPGQTGGF
jgi:hypothetical protein